MKIIGKISYLTQVLAMTCCLASCNYLDVIPPAQAEYEDTMNDAEHVLDFLYTCYGGVPRSHPFSFKSFESGADELAFPPTYGYYMQTMQWGTVSPTSNPTYGGDNIWSSSYNFLGYTHEFLNLIDITHPIGLTEEEKYSIRRRRTSWRLITNLKCWKPLARWLLLMRRLTRIFRRTNCREGLILIIA